MEIRRAETLSDAEAILAVDRLTFGDCHASALEILGILREDYIAYVAWQDGKALGYLCLMQVQTLHYRACWVDLVAVVPEWQNRGIAKALIEEGMSVAKASGAEFLSALVRRGNKSSFNAFRHHGFGFSEEGFDLFIKDL